MQPGLVDLTFRQSELLRDLPRGVLRPHSRLHDFADGGEVIVADLEQDRAQSLADELGGRAVPPETILTTECEVFAPCGPARVITADLVPRLRCRLVAGAANDTLDTPETDGALLARGITFVPDYVANAGGVVHEHARATGWSDARLAEAVDAIGERVLALVEEAADSEQEHPREGLARGGRTPRVGGSLVAAAERRGLARLEAAGGRATGS